MKQIFVLTTLILALLSCEKDDTTTISEKEEIDYKGNRVAFDLDLRIGVWANVSDHISSKDTIVFHNDSIWSNYYINKHTGKREGIIEKKYKFQGVQLVFYDGYDGKPLEEPIHRHCQYSDSTGLFSIFLNGLQREDVYKKVE
ncbi:MAG: hypothetical protein RI562_09260 [Salibacter sp.]|uniref:hypothetical protein n=2 Tax=Salibacter sp. TaxID=2010995 RepID=UPI00287043EB|nr:hypothetical protein [Salibacter sp.]MDR9399239.1 hypothetical protein [Salibacter sp.]